MDFSTPLGGSFYRQSTIEVAKALIGKHIVHVLDGQMVIGRVTETEAYLGFLDPACHSFNNKRTKRTSILYGEPGHVYTYTMHTHCLLNIVCEPLGQPEAVLIRSIEPVEGICKMEELRGMQHTNKAFSNGPGKLTKAMGVTMGYYGHSLLERPLYLSEGNRKGELLTTKRIGIGGARQAKQYPWRFIEARQASVST